MAADPCACRQVGTAAPVLAALAGGGDREATVSALYGGSGGADSATSAVYAAIGNVRSRMLTCAEMVLSIDCQRFPTTRQLHARRKRRMVMKCQLCVALLSLSPSLPKPVPCGLM